MDINRSPSNKWFGIIAVVISLLSVSIGSYAQGLETIGGGIIDFLLTNPTTADKFNPTQTAALDAIGGLLKISAHRKHELNVANTGKSEVVINTNDNRQATLYADSDGNFYLLFNKIVYPLSTSLVNQARGESAVSPVIKNSTLPGYDLIKLTTEYQLENQTETFEYILTDEATIAEIARRNNVSVNDIHLRPVYFVFAVPGGYKLISYGELVSKQNANSTKCRKLFEDGSTETIKPASEEFVDALYRKTPPRAQRTYITSVQHSRSVALDGIFITKSIDKIATIFTCNWAYDFGGDGLGIEDFQGIKRSFVDNENIQFFMASTTENPSTYDFKIYEALTGKEIKSKTGSVESGGKVNSVALKNGEVSPGVYIYTFKLISPGQETAIKTEKFEIITSEEKVETQNQNTQHEGSLVTPCYIIGCSTNMNETSAQSDAEQLRQKGFRAGYMWIPDYEPNGKAAYRVYVGPFKTEKTANETLALVKQLKPSAYVKLIH